MKKYFILYFTLFFSCISVYVEGTPQFVDINGLNSEIELINKKNLKNFSLGYGFGAGFYYPSVFLLRMRFSEQKFESKEKINKFYFQTGFIEGGANVFKSKVIGIYPLVGIGASFQELLIDGKSYRNYIYPVINGGLEVNVNLTKDMPGIFALYLRLEGFYSSGYFLDRPDYSDFVISNPLKGISLSFGFSMGYKPED